MLVWWWRGVTSRIGGDSTGTQNSATLGSVIASAIVRSLTRRDSGGEVCGSQYLPNNSAHQRASRNFAATEAAREYFRARPHSGQRTTCGPQQKADSGLLPSWPTGYAAPPSRCGSCEVLQRGPTRVCQRPLAAELRRSSPSCHKARRSSFVQPAPRAISTMSPACPWKQHVKGNQPAQLRAWVSRSSVQVLRQEPADSRPAHPPGRATQTAWLAPIDTSRRPSAPRTPASPAIRSIEVAP